MLKLIRRFFASKDANPFLVVGCLLLASLSEAVGIGALLPVIGIAAGSEAGSNSPLSQAITQLMGAIGLEPRLGTLVVLVATLMVLKSLLSYAALAYATIAASRVALKLRQRLIAAVLKARWSYFSDQRSGRVFNIIGHETSQVAEGYIVAATVVAACVQAVAYFAIAVAVNPLLAFVGIATGAAITLALQRFVRLARKSGFKQTGGMMQLSGYMVDLLANMKALKSMERQQPILNTIDEVFQKLRRAFVRRELAKAGLARGGDVMTALIAAAGLWLGSVYLKVPFAELLVSAVVFNQLVSVLTKLQRTLQLASVLEAAQVRSFETISYAEQSQEMSGGSVIPDLERSPFRFDSVRFSHGEKLVLDGVSLEIPPNGTTVLTGPSGAGKTTLVDLLIGFYQPQSGTISIGSTPLSDVNIKEWRSKIGYVPQELTLFHDTVRMNLTLGDSSIGDERIYEALRQSGAYDFVSGLARGLDTDVGEMGSKLSGGQRQRISLARALVTDPKVLILDEVTSALDPVTEAEIVDNIAGLRGKYTIIAITHRMAWMRIADNAYTVMDGHVSRAERVH